MYPDDLKYAKTHEWVCIEGNTAKIGITSHAISELGDLTFLEFNIEPETTLNQGEIFGEVESVKTTSELYIPISGKIIAVNTELSESLDELTEDPYQSWMLEVEITSQDELEELMDASSYREHVGE